MDDAVSVLPSPFEKLSIKFILDEIRDQQQAKADPETLVNLAKDNPVHHLAAKVLEMPEESTTNTLQRAPNLPLDKKYFRIGEVAECIGVEPHVLRYWESEFRTVKPVKTSAGHRVYSRKDVKLLIHIKHLLHVEKFSIQGAKRALLKQRREIVDVPDSKYVPLLKAIVSDLRLLIHSCKQI